LTDRLNIDAPSFSETGFLRLASERSELLRAGVATGPLVGTRMVIDGRDAVSVTFRCAGDGASGAYLVLNTVTDRARDRLELFRMERVRGVDPWVLSCALPSDVIVSYQFVPVGPGGLDPRVVDDRRAWARVLASAVRDRSHPRVLVNGRGHVASLFAGPDARLVWPDREVSSRDMRAAREVECAVPLAPDGASPRRRVVVVHDGEGAPVRTLILFDGQVWRANGVGWLTRRYPGLRVVTIDAGELGERERELTDAGRVEALVGAVCDEVGVGPIALAGQSYGGLGVLEAALGGTLPVECYVAQSPSLWWGGGERGRGEGTLMGALSRGERRLPDGLTLWCQVGEREVAMRPVVRRCAGLLDGATSLVRFETYSGGHDVAWWREGLLRALDEWCVRDGSV
jgi:putative ferric enterochelin esterase